MKIFDPERGEGVYQMFAEDALPHWTYWDTVATEAASNIVWIIATQNIETLDHMLRVADLARTLGGWMGLSSSRIRALELAALLHDIGKLGVPPQILCKEGPLTPEEKRKIKIHPEFGARLIASLPCQLLKQVARTIEQHHERWDGGGFPKGLKQTEIMLEARILAVADTFDALTSPRPYRAEPLTMEEAKKEIMKNAGTQFDPLVALTFVTHFGQLPNGAQQVACREVREPGYEQPERLS
ncbi:MAG: hypothetical protein C4319_09055 [Acidimicrobiia bacterium]